MHGTNAATGIPTRPGRWASCSIAARPNSAVSRKRFIIRCSLSPVNRCRSEMRRAAKVKRKPLMLSRDIVVPKYSEKSLVISR